MNNPFESHEVRALRHDLALLGWCDPTLEEWHQKPPECRKTGKLTVRFLLPRFSHPYGGVFTALRLADAVNRRGATAQIVVYDAPQLDSALPLRAVRAAFPSLEESRFFSGEEMPSLPAPDVGVATFWPSCYHLLRMECARRVYLVQDYEPAFYPAGTEYALAENTYRMPFDRLYNTTGLRDFVEGQYPLSGAQCHAITPACDERFQPVEREHGNPWRVLFYARPDAPRNAFSLCYAFARALKERYHDGVDCVCAGANLSPQLQKATRDAWSFAGVVPYADLPVFYGSFDFAVCFMFTKHPSYIPIEAMACGCAAIVNRNEANAWFFCDGKNCVVADPSVNALLHAFERAKDPAVFARITRNGQRTVRRTSWETELNAALDFLGVR